MDPVVIGPILNALDTIVVVPSVLSRLFWFTRTIFNPLFFGFGFLLCFIYAWCRMERIAEVKRLDANSRILLKKSSDTRISLLHYTDQTNGKVFGVNTFTDIIKSMSSKGKTPLKMASICQPVVRQTGAHVLWESSVLRIRTVPVTEGDKPELFEQIRTSSTMSIKDASQIIAHGGVGHWIPKKGMFSKELTVYISFNFHDAINFMGIFADSYRMKRLCSVSVRTFLEFKEIDLNQRLLRFETVDQIRFHDDPFFNAVCLIACHSERKHSEPN